MNNYTPSLRSTLVIGLILTALEVACAAGVAYYLNGHLWPMVVNAISILITISFVSFWTNSTIRKWNSGSDPTYRDPGVQMGARVSSRLSLVFF
jgi:ABC-type spermidine/putrescine transport system permease subunit I